MRLLVQHRMIFGKPLVYPVNEAAREACFLLRRKTLSSEELRGLERLGHEIEWLPQGEATAEPSTEPRSGEGVKATEGKYMELMNRYCSATLQDRVLGTRKVDNVKAEMRALIKKGKL